MEARSRLESGTQGAIKAAKQVYELLFKKIKNQSQDTSCSHFCPIFTCFIATSNHAKIYLFSLGVNYY